MVGERVPIEGEVDQHLPLDAIGATPVYAAVSLEELESYASQETARVMLEILLEHPEMEIRPEQLEALDALEACREEASDRALLHMATGLGKTTIAAIEAKRFLEVNPSKRILWLSHQNDINDQARKRFEKILGSGHTFGNFTGEERDYHDVTCLFASFQVMRDWQEAFLKDEFAFIIVDESHHSKANTYEPTLRYFTPEFLLGITGTPDRHDLRDIREIFGQEVYKLPLEEAIARGLLAEVDYRVISDDIAIKKLLQENQRKYARKLTAGEIDRTIFLPMKDAEMAQIIKEHSAELEGPSKRIIFCKSVEQTEEFAQYFEHAAPLHSKLPKHEQDKYIEQFRKGEIDTLLTVDMFNEGMDIPDANQIVFLRSTQSQTVFLQQLGRGLRKIPGKESVQVLDFVANCDRLAMLDDMWRSIRDYVSDTQETQPSKLIRIDIGGVSFSEEIREILEILDDIRVTSEQARSWTAADSISLFKQLEAERKAQKGPSGRVRKYLSAFAIEQNAFHNGGPSLRTVLSPFGGDMDALRVAAGSQVWKKYSRDELVDFLVDKIEATGRTPTSTEFMAFTDGPALNQFRNHFDSYEDYKKAANRRWLERRRNRQN